MTILSLCKTNIIINNNKLGCKLSVLHISVRMCEVKCFLQLTVKMPLSPREEQVSW